MCGYPRIDFIHSRLPQNCSAPTPNTPKSWSIPIYTCVVPIGNASAGISVEKETSRGPGVRYNRRGNPRLSASKGWVEIDRSSERDATNLYGRYNALATRPKCMYPACGCVTDHWPAAVQTNTPASPMVTMVEALLLPTTARTLPSSLGKPALPVRYTGHLPSSSCRDPLCPVREL